MVDFRAARAAEILHIPYGGARDSAPCRAEGEVAPTLLASGAGTARPAGISSEPDYLVPCGRGGVRRLTPRECERLQGLPDDWTRFGANGCELPDSVRYRLIGNSVAVPVVEWIARRIVQCERIGLN